MNPIDEARNLIDIIEKATPGPWEAEDALHQIHTVKTSTADLNFGSIWHRSTEKDFAEANINAICGARNDAPRILEALVKRVEFLEMVAEQAVKVGNLGITESVLNGTKWVEKTSNQSFSWGVNLVPELAQYLREKEEIK